MLLLCLEHAIRSGTGGVSRRLRSGSGWRPTWSRSVSCSAFDPDRKKASSQGVVSSATAAASSWKGERLDMGRRQAAHHGMLSLSPVSDSRRVYCWFRSSRTAHGLSWRSRPCSTARRRRSASSSRSTSRSVPRLCLLQRVENLGLQLGVSEWRVSISADLVSHVKEAQLGTFRLQEPRSAEDDAG